MTTRQIGHEIGVILPKTGSDINSRKITAAIRKCGYVRGRKKLEGYVQWIWIIPDSKL